MTGWPAVLRRAATQLAAAGVASPRLDAELLAAHLLGCGRGGLIALGDAPPPPALAARFAALVAERAARRPLAQIVGHREFWSLTFTVTADTLDPRPDSETLIAAVLRRLGARRQGPLRLLDLGTGTGCLLAALLRECPAAQGLGVDRSAAAAAVARDNLAALGLGDRAAIVEGDWLAGVAGRFDVVVANPPYIPAADHAGLQPEVRLYEPRMALVGGADGLEAYRAIFAALPPVLAPAGLAAVEIGAGQAEAVAALMAGSGLAAIERDRDLAGHERVLSATAGTW